LNVLCGRARHLDTLFAEPLLEHRGPRSEQVDLVQSQRADPLEFVLFRRSLQCEVLGHKRVLAEDDPEAVLSAFDLL
jgi:hypothetical protein